MTTKPLHFLFSCLSSPEPHQAASLQRPSRTRPAEMEPGSEAPWSRLSQRVHQHHLHALLSWIHWPLRFRKVCSGAESLSQCTPEAHSGCWRRLVKYSHWSLNVSGLQRVEMRTWWICTAGWCLCPQGHLGTAARLVAPGQPWCEVGFWQDDIPAAAPAPGEQRHLHCRRPKKKKSNNNNYLL